MKLELKKFDMNIIEDESVVVFVGRRRTGKSVLVKDLLYHKQDIPIGTVICPTESANEGFKKIVPPIFIHDEYSPKLVNQVLARQKQITKRINKEKRINGYSNLDPRAFLLLDDCLYDDCWKRDTSIKYIFLNGRHQRIMLLITMQYPLGIPPNLRTNVDFVFILREPELGNRKRIYQNYAGMFPSFQMFCTVMDQCTENYECLVIHNNAKTSKLSDQVFWYKAEEHENFTTCSREAWILNNQYAVDDEEDEDELYDPSKFIKNKGPIINVKKTYG